MVPACPLLRFADHAIPTWENSRSTAADDAGQPKYCRAITVTFGYSSACSRHHCNGSVGLFGIFAHGITETWVMEKALLGLVACEKQRHTAENISKWTEEALEAIGLTAKGLLAPDE